MRNGAADRSPSCIRAASEPSSTDGQGDGPWATTPNFFIFQLVLASQLHVIND